MMIRFQIDRRFNTNVDEVAVVEWRARELLDTVRAQHYECGGCPHRKLEKKEEPRADRPSILVQLSASCEFRPMACPRRDKAHAVIASHIHDMLDGEAHNPDKPQSSVDVW